LNAYAAGQTPTVCLSGDIEQFHDDAFTVVRRLRADHHHTLVGVEQRAVLCDQRPGVSFVYDGLTYNGHRRPAAAHRSAASPGASSEILNRT